ncbi:hypothetical protein [Nonomuraea sp. SBT364]|uniref:hypothetical protein n=1 Tax=Nonomuraea sp. SBT364 TaxID=1580530 RepID=UPI00066CDAB2|nr:hypothetical protein [Nonomuraea sp. SBT364]
MPGARLIAVVAVPAMLGTASVAAAVLSAYVERGFQPGTGWRAVVAAALRQLPGRSVRLISWVTPASSSFR